MPRETPIQNRPCALVEALLFGGHRKDGCVLSEPGIEQAKGGMPSRGKRWVGAWVVWWATTTAVLFTLQARSSAVESTSEDAGPQLRSRTFALTDQDRAWWSFQPIKAPHPPRLKHGGEVRNEIDMFLLARLEAQGLGFSPPAHRRELIRRAYFDLIGLPPTPEEVESFEHSTNPQAWEKLIDDLLARPQYGERWARHWLDVVRYAESNGYERDGAKPDAWRYRDYVIDSFNQDKPYDRFVLEQLAGDELGEGFDPAALVATGFYRLHVWDDEPDSTLVAEFDDLDDIMVTTGAAFLGLTVGCARCHDHKFDPLSQADYYRMLAFVRSISPYGLHKTGGGGRGVGRISRALAPEDQIASWNKEKETRLRPLQQRLSTETNAAARSQLEASIRQVEAQVPYGQALAVNEDPIKPTQVLRRGDVHSPGEEVQPAFPVIFGQPAPSLSTSNPGASSGRRLALARWIASPDNPLTARVIVNRLWQHHFGEGLVKTPNDFGRTGLRPTNPELLDHLAAELVRGGWRLKRLHKQILMSRAYQMSSHPPDGPGRSADEANRFFWRQNPRRLEAEIVRDSILSVSGVLNQRVGGPSFFPTLPREVHRTQDGEGKGWQESAVGEQQRRSIYIFVKRALLLPLLETFDYTTTTLPVGERPITTVAPQALMLLNDSWVQTLGSRMAERLLRECGPDRDRQIERAFALVLQRSPTQGELEAALRFLRDQDVRPPASGGDAGVASLRNLCVAFFNFNEFLYVD